MNIRMQLRTLATASMVALAVVIVPAGSAYAAKNNPFPKSSSTCVAQGYDWDGVKGCADKACGFHPLYGSGHHGDIAFGTVDAAVCDGFTGNWVVLKVDPPKPSGPAAPLPTTNQRSS